MTALVSTEWLAERLSESDVRIADASWYMPGAGRFVLDVCCKETDGN